MSDFAHDSVEPPVNGIAGLRNWKQDAIAGLLVSLTSLPLSLGIAVASGAPPIAGLISAIVAGLIMPFLGGSFVTISGPAAGLAPALLAAIAVLGKGNLDRGYPLLLCVIATAGCIQIVLSRLGAARLSAAFPAAVVEGMLASIGFMIIAKQLPNFIGHPYKAHEFFGYVMETPAELRLLDPRVFTVGVICLVLLAVLGHVKAKWLRVVPPPLFAVVVGLVLSRIVGIDGAHLIHVPDNVLAHGIVLPNFAGLASQPDLWKAAILTVLTLTLIDGVESLATIAAIDRIDPFRRKSDPDRTLLAMGVCNVASSLVGGLTIIPGGVKSKVCVDGGGRTLWANFTNAICLLIFLFLAKPLINLIPYSALAAILIYTGYKMCAPAVWRHMAKLGNEQLFLFTFTILVTLLTDLLWGIAAGMAAKFLLNLYFAWHRDPERPESLAASFRHCFKSAARLFRNPVTRRELASDAYRIYVDHPVACFNSAHVARELAKAPSEDVPVVMHFSERVPLIDHTSLENLLHHAAERQRTGRAELAFEGLDRLHPLSDEPSSMRVAPVPVATRTPTEPVTS